MARQLISANRVDISGLTNPTYTTIPVDGVEFKNTGNEILHIKATTAAAITIITSQTVDGGLAIDDKVINLGAGEEIFLTSLDKKYFNTADGTVYVDSDQTDTDILIIKK